MILRPVHIALLSCILLVLACGKSIERFESGSSTVGHASWYGPKFHGRKTASGEVYNMHHFTAAHRTAPFGTRVRVTNLNNQESVVVRINDRGPFIRGRIIDLSYAAAKDIGLIGTGTAKVRLEFQGIGPGPTRNAYQYYIQVGSFQRRDNAQRLLDQLRQEFPGEGGKVQLNGGLYRVFLGPKKSETQARELMDELDDEGYSSFLVPRS